MKSMMFDLYIIIIMTIILRTLIKDNTSYLIASFFSGILFGFVKVAMRDKK